MLISIIETSQFAKIIIIFIFWIFLLYLDIISPDCVITFIIFGFFISSILIVVQTINDLFFLISKNDRFMSIQNYYIIKITEKLAIVLFISIFLFFIVHMIYQTFS